MDRPATPDRTRYRPRAFSRRPPPRRIGLIFRHQSGSIRKAVFPSATQHAGRALTPAAGPQNKELRELSRLRGDSSFAMAVPPQLRHSLEQPIAEGDDHAAGFEA